MQDPLTGDDLTSCATSSRLPTLPRRGASRTAVRAAPAPRAVAGSGWPRSPPAPAHGGYAHFREERERGSVEWWVAADGSGRVRQTVKHEALEALGRSASGFKYVVRLPREAGLQRWERHGPRWVRDARFGPGAFAGVLGIVSPTVLDLDVRSLPRDPAELDAELRRALSAAAVDGDRETGFLRGRTPTDAEVFRVVEQTLAHPLAPPEVRAALYEVAGGLEGAEAVEDVADPSGRPASLLWLEHKGERMEVYFDAGTAALLARRITYPNFTDTRVYTPPEAVRKDDSSR